MAVCVSSLFLWGPALLCVARIQGGSVQATPSQRSLSLQFPSENVYLNMVGTSSGEVVAVELLDPRQRCVPLKH